MYQRKKNRGMFRGRLLFQAVLVFLPLILVFALVAQTASAKTYVITDGQRTITYTTLATDPAQVLENAGMELTDADTVQIESWNLEDKLLFSRTFTQDNLFLNDDYPQNAENTEITQ